MPPPQRSLTPTFAAARTVSGLAPALRDCRSAPPTYESAAGFARDAVPTGVEPDWPSPWPVPGSVWHHSRYAATAVGRVGKIRFGPMAALSPYASSAAVLFHPGQREYDAAAGQFGSKLPRVQLSFGVGFAGSVAEPALRAPRTRHGEDRFLSADVYKSSCRPMSGDKDAKRQPHLRDAPAGSAAGEQGWSLRPADWSRRSFRPAPPRGRSVR
jgi:hypothetical protein